MTNTITVKVLRDSDAESPRHFDNLGVMACWHRRYRLGDVMPSESPEEWLAENAPEGSVVLPLYLYDHSGISMRTGSFGDMWDSGRVGYIVATPETIRKAYLMTDDEVITDERRTVVEACLTSEVKVYDDFLTGNVWGYTIEKAVTCECCGNSDSEDVDSCWGFYGDDLDGMKEHAAPEYHEALEEAWRSR